MAVLKGTGESAATYFINPDNLNAPHIITNAAGTAVWTWDHLDFGNNAPNQNPNGLGVFNYNLRFPGQYADAESGLYNNYFRDYSPNLGRYVQSDPIGLKGGIDTFGYVGGNPVSNIDPDGLQMVLPAPGLPLPIPPMYIPGSPQQKQWTNLTNKWGNEFQNWLDNILYSKPPADAKDPNGAKAPGKPCGDEGFNDPKGGENWVKNPKGRGYGWEDSKGNVWVPTGPGGSAHGGPHWDVQKPGGGYKNVRPGQNINDIE